MRFVVDECTGPLDGYGSMNTTSSLCMKKRVG